MTESTRPVAGDSLPPDAAVSDQSLLRRLRLGSQDAATALYLRYARRLEGLAHTRCGSDLSGRLDAEDIVQSVFRSFFRGVNQGHYSVPAGAELWGLLMVIALNKIRAQGNYHRAACRDVGVTVGEAALAQRPSNSVSADGDSLVFLRLVIEETLDRLPTWRRQIVCWRIDGHDIAEIAERSGRSRRTTERVLQEFRQLLNQVLTEDD